MARVRRHIGLGHPTRIDLLLLARVKEQRGADDFSNAADHLLRHLTELMRRELGRAEARKRISLLNEA